ncbi:serine/threonine-protein kinase [Couchioplanes caeruleus]|uniref:non-specific serine/threonine protein kinase n=2 Tax=Couchioplanes caeruleus TaxID=56438 RepID=A0A1K0GN57_9ACTN|nr:serine/threonine-protein kinase [Couchioplanes caeruleus]OJF10635.1 serine/threonine protein kinase [Couchioplanes caeruleus subsp. caeruleus]ROP30370.1 serine/threonine-protein kinase [Couchioplanes caeruleus]
MGWLATGREGGHVGGRYRLIERLGTGGMSVVWRGYDEVLGRPVAVKVLSPQLAADAAFRARLRQEALAAARLCHPHITGVFDYGESPLDECVTVPYVVMELNDGEPVSARLRREGPFPWRGAVTVVAEVASALATAHARGIVHRDVTPANVMLTGAGAKVVDFGISALAGQRDAAADGSLLGTPAYLAPERLSGDPVAPAADVYALGLLLYRLLTGRLPWPAETTTEALRAHLYADPEPVPDLPGMPAEVAALCLHCLAKRPEDRPGADEVATTLAALVGLQPIIPPVAAYDERPVPVGFRPHPHPGPSAPPRRVLPLPSRLRLRAGLRVARALRIGGPVPLGGGLFRGGVLARDLLSGGRLGHAALAARHRLQAAVATLVLIASVGLVWSSTREPVDAATAQAAAAGAGPGPAVPHGMGCRVRYRIQRDTGTDFGAQLTVVNTGERVLSTWRLEFTFTGGQRLTDGPKRLSQKGRKLVLRPKQGAHLRPGRSASVTLSGSYRVSNPLPLSFTLNGHQCQAEVLGAIVEPAPAQPAPAATRKKDRSKPASPSPAAPAPSSPPRTKGGFSVAI